MDWDPEVAELGLRFCQSVGLRGLLNVEFKRDSRDGELKLIECNHRFTASTALHLAAGLNVRAVHLQPPARRSPLPRDRASLPRAFALWYPLDDLRAFKDYRRVGEMTSSVRARA